MIQKALNKTITVKILFFASLKNYFNTSEKTITINENTTLKELRNKLFLETNISQEKLLTLLYAINHNYVSLDTLLKDGDEIAFLPMVSGG